MGHSGSEGLREYTKEVSYYIIYYTMWSAVWNGYGLPIPNLHKLIPILKIIT
jgi:hypothetical protein